MNNISLYKERFYNLMESTMGDVRPIIKEQQCTLSESDIKYIVGEVIKEFSPNRLNRDLDSLTKSFRENVSSDLVFKVFNEKLETIKTSLKPTFEKYVSDMVYATFFGGVFDINAYLYDMLNKIILPLLEGYDASWATKGAANAVVNDKNVNNIITKTQNYFLAIISNFFSKFRMTITLVPLTAIQIAKNLKKCDVKSNPQPYGNVPDVESFKSGNSWIMSSINDRIKNAV
jgi:hypothetical protein